MGPSGLGDHRNHRQNPNRSAAARAVSALARRTGSFDEALCLFGLRRETRPQVAKARVPWRDHRRPASGPLYCRGLVPLGLLRCTETFLKPFLAATAFFLAIGALQTVHTAAEPSLGYRVTLPQLARDSTLVGRPALPECFKSGTTSYGCLIETIAGSGPPDVGDSGPATAALLQNPTGTVVGPDEKLYIVDTNNHRIRRFTLGGNIETVVGTGSAENRVHGDGGPAVAAQLRFPGDIAFGPDGLLYIADNRNYRIRRVGSDGIISTVAGNGSIFNNPAVEGLPATDAGLSGPSSIAFDGAGRLYIAESDRNRVWRVGPTGALELVAGAGTPGPSGDGGPARAAGVTAHSIAISGNSLYIAGNGELRRVDLVSGVITSLPGPAGDYVDTGAAGQILYTGQHRVYSLNPQTGETSILAGTGNSGFVGDGGPALDAWFLGTTGVSADVAGNLYVADRENNRIRRVSPSGIITTVAGGRPAVSPVDTAEETVVYDSQGIVVDKAGNVLYVDFDHSFIRRLTPAGVVTTVAGSGGGTGGDGGHPLDARFNAPKDLVLDPFGNLLFIDEHPPSSIRRISPGADGLIDGSADELIITVAGKLVGGQGEFADHGTLDGGPARNAIFVAVRSIAVDSKSNLYLADWLDYRVRKVVPGADGVLDGDADEIITTVAGNGLPGSSGDSGLATKVALETGGGGLALDRQDNLYVRDVSGSVRRVDPTTGAISTFALGSEVGNFASFAFSASGFLYTASDTRISRWDPVSRTAVVIAGTGEFGFSGDGGHAPAARLWGARNLAFDAHGDLYTVDNGNFRIRKVTFVVR